jgi:hypothetical protein
LDSTRLEPLDQSFNALLNMWQQLAHILLGKEGIYGSPAMAMQRVRRGSEQGSWDSDALRLPAPFVPPVAGGTGCVQDIPEVGRGDVQLVRIDAHDGSVLFVKTFDLPNVLAPADDVVIEFVPEGGGGELWAWEVGYRTEE